MFPRFQDIGDQTSPLYDPVVLEELTKQVWDETKDRAKSVVKEKVIGKDEKPEAKSSGEWLKSEGKDLLHAQIPSFSELKKLLGDAKSFAKAAVPVLKEYWDWRRSVNQADNELQHLQVRSQELAARQAKAKLLEEQLASTGPMTQPNTGIPTSQPRTDIPTSQPTTSHPGGGSMPPTITGSNTQTTDLSNKPASKAPEGTRFPGIPALLAIVPPIARPEPPALPLGGTKGTATSGAPIARPEPPFNAA